MQIRLIDRAHQGECKRALIEGLHRHGITDLGPRVAVCWGWRVGRQYRAQGFDVLVFERGYIGDRFRWTSIAWNGLNGRGNFPEYPDDSGARFRACGFSLRPWNRGGSYVLLVGQVHGDAALAGVDLTDWYARTAEQARDVYGLPVHFRAHPMEQRRCGFARTVPGCTKDDGPLADALAGAAVVVTWNSNTGVDALLAGKPTVAMGEGSMAAGIAASGLGDPCCGDRESWAHRLAWRQWDVEEIRSGAALEGVVRQCKLTA